MRSLENFTANDLLNEKDAVNVFVLSTYGSGEMPPRAAKFWQTLSTSDSDFHQVRYSIFGLGNSSFDEFNAASKMLDRKLQQLKVPCIHTRVHDYTQPMN